MATIYRILAVWDDQFTAYKRGTDWRDQGDGTIEVLSGSALEAALALGRSLSVQRSLYDDTLPGGTATWKLNTTASGLKYIGTPSTAFASGVAIEADIHSLHVSEAIGTAQTRIRWQCWADHSQSGSLAIGDCISLRIAMSGSGSPIDEWRGVIIQQNPIIGTDGLRRIEYIANDYGELLRAADTSAVPRTAQAATVQLPSDDGAKPQTLLGGVAAYRLSNLLADIVPATLTYCLNCADVIIERLPDRADALTMLQGVCKSNGLYLRWDCYDKACLIVDQHEHELHSVTAVLTDSHVFEARRELGQPTYSSGQIERVVIERPQDYGDRDAQALPPDRTKPPSATSAGYPLLPTGDSASSSEVTLYAVEEVWTPSQEYTNYEPGPIMFAFGDTAYKNSAYTSGQIHRLLKQQSDLCSISPPVLYTDGLVDGYNGRDYYFCWPPVYTQLRQANDYIDGWVVAKAGYYTESGAVSSEQTPIANAMVTLVGQTTGTVYQVRTDSNGYYRVNNATPDDYSPSVYVDDDTYLANKYDVYTSGHPWDDDPYNDDLGPDNSTQLAGEWRVTKTTVRFTVTYNAAGISDRAGTNSDYETYAHYRGFGSFDYGDSTKQAYVLDDLEGLSLGIDTANVSTELQANQLAEQIIDDAEASKTVIVVTKPFGGMATRSGNVVRLTLADDLTLSVDMRIKAREIVITDDGLVKETISSSVDYFVPEIERTFTRIDRVETLSRELQNRTRDLYRRVQSAAGKLADADQLAAGV